ncbi:unnamed protein product [Meloidogyne enterolobii]|uniref:Uncharacterized protein n=1 Tax=Meloidogyne enterolobii TaxID=390850 RepID=A0ACB1B2R4_MELEN
MGTLCSRILIFLCKYSLLFCSRFNFDSSCSSYPFFHLFVPSNSSASPLFVICLAGRVSDTRGASKPSGILGRIGLGEDGGDGGISVSPGVLYSGV